MEFKEIYKLVRGEEYEFVECPCWDDEELEREIERYEFFGEMVFNIRTMEISKNVTWKTLGEKVIAVKVDTGEYYTLNEVASVIWKAIDEGKSKEDIAEKICTEYDATDKASVLQDIEEQISEWQHELLIL